MRELKGGDIEFLLPLQQHQRGEIIFEAGLRLRAADMADLAGPPQGGHGMAEGEPTLEAAVRGERLPQSAGSGLRGS